MKITTTENFRHKECELTFCQRVYCHRHRLLWRECETVKEEVDDFYLDGSPHYVYSYGSCPSCEYESKKRMNDRDRTSWEMWSAEQSAACELEISQWQEERKKHGKYY